jgi:Asp-tRNA(Asn)/Glu-tRNA(Gln) amidotransferase C subunit
MFEEEKSKIDKLEKLDYSDKARETFAQIRKDLAKYEQMSSILTADPIKEIIDTLSSRVLEIENNLREQEILDERGVKERLYMQARRDATKEVVAMLTLPDIEGIRNLINLQYKRDVQD